VLKAESQLQIGRFLKTVAEARQSLLMLDYDGTLAPFRKKRDQAFPYPGMVQAVQEMIGHGHTRVVIVSGRDASEMLPLLGIESVPEIWGLHGLQRRRCNGNIETVRIGDMDLDALSTADQWLGDQMLRHAAEFKTGSIAVHWRGSSPGEAEELQRVVLTGWRPIAERSGLELLEFDGGVEIRARDVDKGDVVRMLLSEMDPGTPAAFLGDDVTDEAAFRAIEGRGLSVLVRPQWRRTAARVWLRPPDEVLTFFMQWLAVIRAVVMLDVGPDPAISEHDAEGV
jgi:trehalose 6-phosphate phosphatase